MNSKDSVLLLFSGGRDSFLATCRLLENGHTIHLITFENGMGLKDYNAADGADRLIQHYGKTNVKFEGLHSVAGVWRDFFLPYFNMKPSEVQNRYGELTVSQFHCLTCRSAMYVWTIIRAKQLGIAKVADGARKDQGFVIELPNMIKRFEELFKQHSIELCLPVWELDSNWERKNEMLLRGFFPKTMEPQCLIGVPLPGEIAPDKDVQEAVEKYFNDIVLPRANKMIYKYKNVKMKHMEK